MKHLWFLVGCLMLLWGGLVSSCQQVKISSMARQSCRLVGIRSAKEVRVSCKATGGDMASARQDAQYGACWLMAKRILISKAEKARFAKGRSRFYPICKEIAACKSPGIMQLGNGQQVSSKFGCSVRRDRLEEKLQQLGILQTPKLPLLRVTLKATKDKTWNSMLISSVQGFSRDRGFPVTTFSKGPKKGVILEVQVDISERGVLLQAAATVRAFLAKDGRLLGSYNAFSRRYSIRELKASVFAAREALRNALDPALLSVRRWSLLGK